MTYVIAINSVSGGGKTALSLLLAAQLDNSKIIAFDDYEETNSYPDELYEWFDRGANVNEFSFPEMAKDVASVVARCERAFLILDYPFGRSHKQLDVTIDLSVYIDTPIDIALVRWIKRDLLDSNNISDSSLRSQLKTDLSNFSQKGRNLYIDHINRYRDSSDLVLDGTKELNQLVEEIILITAEQ